MDELRYHGLAFHHGHDHADGHCHMHEHGHGCGHAHEAEGAELDAAFADALDKAEADKDAKLLQYMLDHNEHHQEEFCECLEKLKARGKATAAAALEESIALLRQSNDKLSEALAALEEGE